MSIGLQELSVPIVVTSKVKRTYNTMQIHKPGISLKCTFAVSVDKKSSKLVNISS